MNINNFAGVWKLVSSEFERADGVKTYPYGDGAIGMLIYDEHGYMSVHIMHPDHPIFASGDIRNGSQDEIKSAFDGYLAYFGKFDFNERVHADPAPLRLAPQACGVAGQAGWSLTAKLALFVVFCTTFLAVFMPVVGDFYENFSVKGFFDSLVRQH